MTVDCVRDVLVESMTVDSVRDVCHMVEIMTGDCLVDLPYFSNVGDWRVRCHTGCSCALFFRVSPGTRVTMILCRQCVCDARRCGG